MGSQREPGWASGQLTTLAAHGPRPTDEPQPAGDWRYYARRISAGLGLLLSQFAIGVAPAGAAIGLPAPSLAMFACSWH